MKVRIEIDTKTFIRFWLVVIGFVLAGWAIFLAKDAIILIIISLFLALALNAPVSKIAKLLGSKKNRGGATAVAYLLIVAFLGLVVAFVLPTIVEQTNKFIAEIPDFVNSATSQNGFVRKFIEENNLGELVSQLSKMATDMVNEYSKNFGNILFGSLNAIINAVVSLIMILTMTFLMLVEGPSWLEKFWKLYPDQQKQKRHRRIALKMYKSVSAFVNGQLTVSMISGTLGALVVAILSLTVGVPINLAIPVGVILVLVGTIPMFGALIAGIISSLIIASNIWYAGLIFLTYFLIYQQIENSVISPMIQAKNNQLSALLIFVAITVGLHVLGILGAFLSIPIAACLKILFDEYYLEKRRNKPENDEASMADLLKKIN